MTHRPLLAARAPVPPTLLCGGLAALLLLTLGLSSVAEARDPSLNRAEALAAEAKKLGNSPLALGPVGELETWIPTLGRTDATRLLDGLARTRLHPLAEARLQRLRSARMLDGGDRRGSAALLRAQGFVLDWELVGPFPNEGMTGLDQAFPPEADPASNAPAEGRREPVAWRPFGDRHFLGQIDTEALVRPIDGSVVYLATVLHNPKKQKIVLRSAASSAYKVWVSGGLVISVNEDPAGDFDRDAHGIELPAGDHLILVKLANEEGDLLFDLRLTDTAGRAIKGLTTEASPEARAAAAAHPTPGTLFLLDPPLLLYLAEVRKLDDKKLAERSIAMARAANLATLYRPDDVGEPELEFLRQARDIAPNPEVLLVANGLLEEQWRRKEAIDLAFASAPNDPIVRLRRAHTTWQSAGDGHRKDALKMLEALVADAPDFVAAHVLATQMLLDEGLVQSALHRALDLAQRFPDYPAVWQTLSLAAADAPLDGREGEAYASRLQFEASNIGLYGPYASILLQQGKPEAARQLVQRAMATRPDITGFYGLLADIERAAGRLQPAEAAMREMTGLVPGDAGYWTRLGVFLLETGNRDGALEAINHSLELEPQNADLKAYREYLKPSAPGLHEAFVLPVPVLTDKDEARLYSHEDLVLLLDQKVTRVFDNGLSSTFVQRAIKVRTSPGAAAAQTQYITYTPGDEVVDIHKVRVVRADGTVRETWQTFEQSMSEPWYNLHYDYRAMAIVFPDLTRGDTIELQYSISQTASNNVLGDYFGDMWSVQGSEPRWRSRYVLVMPEGRTVDVRAPRLPHKEAQKTLDTPDGKLVARFWGFEEVPRLEDEPQSPGFTELGDYIHASTYKSWQDLTRWYWNLIKDQLVVDSEIRKVVKDTVAGLTDRRQMVGAIYDYVVQNTRYVGLEFGIHGYKPYRTTTCFRRRFGDCKDKASLIKVMLEEAGIPANIVLTRTRRNGAIDGAPASLQIFDHAITYVPEFDLFLDGTAEYSGSGELPWGDQGVQVVVVENGGHSTFRTTPIHPASSNTSTLDFTVDLDAARTRVDVKGEVTGDFAAGWRQRYQTVETRKEVFLQTLGQDFAGARIERLDLSDLSKLEQPVSMSYQFTGARLTEVSPAGLRLLPALRPARLAQRLATLATRTLPLEPGFPFVDDETFHITLPTGWKAGQLPAATRIQSPFGDFSFEIKAGPDKGGRATLEAHMRLQLDAHRVDVADYAAFHAWLQKIDRTLETAVVAPRR